MSSLTYSKVSLEEDEEDHDDDAIELTDLSTKPPLSADGIETGERDYDDDDDDDENYCYDDDYNDDDNDGNDDDKDDRRRRRRRRRRLPGGGKYSHVDDEGEEEGDGDRTISPSGGHSRLPFEFLEEQLLWNVWNRWEEPCILSIGITICPLLPVLVLWMYGAYAFINRFWILWPFVFHGQIRLALSMWYIKCTSIVGFKRRRTLRFVCSVMTVMECVVFGFVYPMIGSILQETFFRDVDGTLVDDWIVEARYLRLVILLGWMVVLLRCCVGGICLTIRTMKIVSPNSYREWRPTFWIPWGGKGVGGSGSSDDDDASFNDTTRTRLYQTFRVLNILMLGLNGLCALSAASHFGPWPVYSLPKDCDDTDETECALPFPSFHHMKVDLDTPTGYRVDLKGLPPLRGGLPFHPRFLNELDGFSTMAPILFYLDGLKEAHEMGDNQNELQGPERIPFSVTAQSVTYLIDVEAKELVHHSAEVDYLDPKRPLILLFPAEPLKHRTHYAVAVLRATDEDGRKLPRTRGMDNMLKATNSDTRTRIVQIVIPALQRAVPWYSFAKEPESLQLIFDFVTVSEELQLGPIRAARDIALETVQAWDWMDHVTIGATEDHDCDGSDFHSLIARTIHLELDVPWFLSRHSRYAFLDNDKIQRRQPVEIGKAKAMIQIPCSVKTASAQWDAGKQLRAVVEFGHGLFNKRDEMTDMFLQKMAHDNGYIMMAMDWRGMSLFDVPVVLKTLTGSPGLFQAVRDNLIQGFANKVCLQHFSQNGMLDLDVFRFGVRPLPTLNRVPPTSAFYGISQGGILGAGYMSTIGKTNLVERGILGVPGTPFALVMTRSLDFVGYDHLLLLNFYNNRHVRMMLTLVQMAWDSTEASGHLARPVNEPCPRLLLQAGLGDSVVPTSAAESLARALGAHTLPNNPRDIFGVSTAPAATNETYLGPQVTFTELLYEKEYSSLPMDDKFGPKNSVHICVRKDKEAIRQIEEFVNTGRVIDICVEDGCRRTSSVC